MRVVDTETLMRDYCAVLADGMELPLVVSGSSMCPFLVPERDTVYLRAPDRALRRGDIAFYRRANGQYVLHRICRVRGGQFWFAGDAQDVREGPLPASCVFAYVTAVYRKGRLEKPGSPLWTLFSGPWLCLIGRRQRILHLYGRLRPHLSRKTEKETMRNHP